MQRYDAVRDNMFFFVCLFCVCVCVCACVRACVCVFFVLFFFSFLFRLNFYGYNIHFESNMINRILHSWPFHMKFLKLVEDSFHKFHIK